MQRAEWRRRVRPTGAWERAGFVWMWVSGMSLRAIARCTGASVTTVYRWIRRWQREGHVLTRTRGCKPRTWKSQRSLVRDTSETKGRQDVSLCSDDFNQSSITNSCKYVFLKTQDKVDIAAAAVPVPSQSRPAPHSSGVICRDPLHDGWPCLSDLASPLPRTPASRTFYFHAPVISPEPVAVRNHHRLALASFMDYLQLHKGASKQLPLMSDYEHQKRCIGESMYRSKTALVLAQWFTASLLCLAAGDPALSYESIHHNSVNEDSQQEALIFAKAVKSVLETHHDPRCSILFFSEAPGALKSFLDGFVSLRVPYGVSVFEVEMKDQDTNKTHAHLSKVVTRARQVR
ncbi:uncharacterized protein LOC135113884 [Scylla paramamosain]|uniref:uncharacterized protein LOC135113884 n=1 Tax=Scylla paramamosain TaxID=85552 RepID=UPI003082F510